MPVVAGLHDVVTSDTFMTMKAKASRRSFVITKRGRPVARVVPLPREASSSLRGSLLHEEDLLAPVDMAWEAPGDRA